MTHSLCTTISDTGAPGQENHPPAASSSQPKGKGKALSKNPSATTMALNASVETADLIKDIKDDATSFNTVMLATMNQLMSSMAVVSADLKSLTSSIASVTGRLSTLETQVAEDRRAFDDFAHSSTMSAVATNNEQASEIAAIRSELGDAQRKLSQMEVVVAAGIPDIRERLMVLEDYDAQRNNQSESSAETSSASASPHHASPPDTRPLRDIPSPDEVIDVDEEDQRDEDEGTDDDDDDAEGDEDWIEFQDPPPSRTPARGRSRSVTGPTPSNRTHDDHVKSTKAPKRSKSTGGVSRNDRAEHSSPAKNMQPADSRSSKRKHVESIKRSPPKRPRSSHQQNSEPAQEDVSPVTQLSPHIPGTSTQTFSHSVPFMPIPSTQAFTTSQQQQPTQTAVPTPGIFQGSGAPPGLVLPPQQHVTNEAILQAVLVNPQAHHANQPSSQASTTTLRFTLDDIRRLGWSSLIMRSTAQEIWSRDKASNHEILRNINNRLLADGLQPILPYPYANRLINTYDTLWDFRNDMDCWLFARGWLGGPPWLTPIILLPAPDAPQEPLADVLAMSQGYQPHTSARGGRGGGRARGTRGGYYAPGGRGFAHM